MNLTNTISVPPMSIQPIAWKKRPLRVLFVSDAPWTTSGYGKQTRFILPMLHHLGVDVACLTSYGVAGSEWTWSFGHGQIPIYPSGSDPFSNDVIPIAAHHWNADVVITLKDVPVYAVEMMKDHVLRWAPMVPVDHEPIIEAVMKAMRVAWCPIAYAPHGLRLLRKSGFRPLYAPHTYDHDIMVPGDRAQARTILGWPQDRYIVATVAVNRGGLPSRKAWPQMIEGVRHAVQKHSEILWYAHTNVAHDGHENGVNLHHLCHMHGISQHIFFPDQNRYRYLGFDESFIANVYRAADVLLATSVGEGFGVPILEAQACGTPVIIGNWTAMEDLLFDGISLSKDEAFHYFDQQGSHIFLPNPAAIGKAITTMIERKGQALSSHVLGADASLFSIDRAVDHWRHTMESMETMLLRETIPMLHRVVPPIG